MIHGRGPAWQDNTPIRWEWIQYQLINLLCGLGREDHMVAQLTENTARRGNFHTYLKLWDPYAAPVCLIHGKGLIVKHPAVFIVKKVRNFLFGFFHSKATFTAVSGNIPAAASKLVHSQDTVVIASLAPGHGGGIF